MSNTKNHLPLLLLFIILLISIWGVISLSFFTQENRQLLFLTTRENGLYEWLTVLAGCCIATIAITRIIKHRKGHQEILAIPLLYLFAIMGVLGSLEEISWGQHIFGFKSEGIFKEYNMQKETNLHNFVPQDYVNLLMQGSVYIAFIFLPIFSYLNIKFITNRVPTYILQLKPSLPTVGIFIISCCFQDYFRPETLLDTSLVWTASLLYLIIITITKIKFQEWLMGILLIITILLTAICDPVFKYNNMQYEIRELLILTGFIFWFLEIGHRKNEKLD